MMLGHSKEVIRKVHGIEIGFLYIKRNILYNCDWREAFRAASIFRRRCILKLGVTHLRVRAGHVTFSFDCICIQES